MDLMYTFIILFLLKGFIIRIEHINENPIFNDFEEAGKRVCKIA